MKVPFLWLGVLASSVTLAYGQTGGTRPATTERAPTPTPAANNSRVVSKSPSRAAKCSGVNPLFVWA